MKWAIIFVGAAVVVAGGIWYFNRGSTDTPQYQTTVITRGGVTNVVTATGTLNPTTNILVGCQVSGTIRRIYVDYNSIVKAGELIAEIDPSTYQATVEQAKANLANAKANLELQQAEATRSAELFTNKLISGSDYDTAIATRDEAMAMVQISEASLTNALANLGYCKIYSPIDGIVIVNNVQVGQTVAASFNTPELFEIANDLTNMQIDSSVAEADIGGVIDGQRVFFTVEAYPDRAFYGTVVQVRNAPTIVNNVVTYDCVIDVTNADYKLKPGMTANPLSIIIAEKQNVLKIQNAALRFHPSDVTQVENITNVTPTEATAATNLNMQAGSQGNRRGSGAGGQRAGGGRAVHTVYVLSGKGRDAKLQAVQIKTGISDGIYTEVLSGLNEGDHVVTGSLGVGTQTASPTSNPFGGGGRRF